MRKDMSKVLVEDGRHGGSEYAKKLKRSRRRKLNRNLDENSPKRESTSRHRNFGYESKTLNETLKPLVRFLNSRVGRLWDEVYSEIREHPNNHVQLHIMKHLWRFVDREVKISDQGVPVMPDGRGQRLAWMHRNDNEVFTVNGKEGWYKAIGGSSNWPNFHVDDEGVLTLTQPPQRYVRPPEAKIRHREGRRLFRMFEGIWFEMVVVPLPDGWVWGGTPRRNNHSDHCEGIYRAMKGSYRWVSYDAKDYGPEDKWYGEAKPGNILRKRRFGHGWQIPSLHGIKQTYGRLDVYCDGTKRQVNRRDLKRFGLENDRQLV